MLILDTRKYDTRLRHQIPKLASTLLQNGFNGYQGIDIFRMTNGNF
jgi:hypothetical protein